MSNIKKVTGDLVALAKEGYFDVLVHGCNCFNTMGAGVAKQIKQNFPKAYEVDCETESGSIEKLGTYTHADITLENGSILTVVNAYTQYDYGTKEKKIDLAALSKVFRQIARDFAGKIIAYPAIGAGLAGGSWIQIKPVIDQALVGQRHVFVEFGKISDDEKEQLLRLRDDSLKIRARTFLQ